MSADTEPILLATAMLTACHHGDHKAVADLMNGCDFHTLAGVLACMTGIAIGFATQLSRADGLDIEIFLQEFGLNVASSEDL